MLAMHWGTFELSDEPIDEPVERLRAGWRQRANDPERLWVLEPGETRCLRTSR
jgi:L-ascorbate metabolism protein UlaG (beta-lactamase superfamily)